MANKKLLSIFFGNSSLHLAEIEKKDPRSFFEVSHSLFEDVHPGSEQNISNEIKLTAILQKSLRDQRIETTETCLILPNQDVILRSFTIPAMSTAEIKGVVDFEARRYIPFKLEDLAYTYHAFPIVERKTRNIRILFVGIRRDALEKYCLMLEQAGLRITAIEPSSVSLLRLLTSKKLLLHNQKIAIIQFNKTDGTIIISDQNVPQFIRDFRILTPAMDASTIDADALKARLANETRISLDYYRRQNPQGQIDKILFVSSHLASSIGKSLGQELNIPTQCLSVQSLLNREEEFSTETLSTFGGGLKDAVSFLPNINLIKTRQKAVEAERPVESFKINYNVSLKVAAVCAGVAILMTLFFNRDLIRYQSNMANLNKKQGAYESLTEAELLKKSEETKSKVEQYKSVRLKSDVTFFLKKVPQLLPSGAWLSGLNVSYSEKMPPSYGNIKITANQKFQAPTIQVSLEMTGYVFNPDASEQINLVNNLVANLQNDQELAKMFNAISLVKAQKQEMNENTVTQFQVSCQ